MLFFIKIKLSSRLCLTHKIVTQKQKFYIDKIKNLQKKFGLIASLIYLIHKKSNIKPVILNTVQQNKHVENFNLLLQTQLSITYAVKDYHKFNLSSSFQQTKPKSMFGQDTQWGLRTENALTNGQHSSYWT